METEILKLLDKLVGFVESATPVIWAAAQQRVIADILANAIWLAVMIVAIIVVLKAKNIAWAMAKQAEENREDPDGWYAISIGSAMLIGVGIFVAVTLSVTITRMAVNPTYYAIQNIISLAGGGS